MSDASNPIAFDLAVVMPVYNEAECVSAIVESWLEVLAAEGLRFRLIVLNDGSTDATGEALRRSAQDERVEIVTKQNSGHGPTILMGYRRAVELAAWVFQVDSDGEVPASEFPSLWSARADRDAVFGVRTSRRQPAMRWVITRASRLLVRLLYGVGVSDVNVPFRLMRAEVLASFLDAIPGDTFAPNVVIAGVFSRGGGSFANVPVRHQERRTGRVSIIHWKLWKAAALAAMQTVRCRRLLRSRRISAADAATNQGPSVR